jgi:MFS transporter, DHA1 family, multidrug resistance protein
MEKRGWNLGVGALPFIAIIVGAAIGGSIIAYLTLTRFKQKMLTAGRVIPEERLVAMAIGGIFFPIGMFWFAWTSDPNIHWAAQVVAGVPIGAGIMMIFMQGLSYIIDCYLMHANSALAGSTLVRSIVGAIFPLFATYMYDALDVDWATSLLGFVTVACIPVPVLFYIYGARVRSWSKYSPY